MLEYKIQCECFVLNLFAMRSWYVSVWSGNIWIISAAEAVITDEALKLTFSIYGP